MGNQLPLEEEVKKDINIMLLMSIIFTILIFVCFILFVFYKDIMFLILGVMCQINVIMFGFLGLFSLLLYKTHKIEKGA